MNEQEFTPEPPDAPDAPVYFDAEGAAGFASGWHAGWKAGYLARQEEEEPTPLRKAVRARMQPDPDVVREAVPCDFCGAGIGAPCTVWVESSLERPMPLYRMVHQTRTAQWRETR